MSARLLSDFIRALRASDVRVSTGEAIDAAGTVKLIGFEKAQDLDLYHQKVLIKFDKILRNG